MNNNIYLIMLSCLLIYSNSIKYIVFTKHITIYWISSFSLKNAKKVEKKYDQLKCLYSYENVRYAFIDVTTKSFQWKSTYKAIHQNLKCFFDDLQMLNALHFQWLHEFGGFFDCIFFSFPAPKHDLSIFCTKLNQK